MTPGELREEIAVLLPPGSFHLTESLAVLAEAYALVLLGARLPACRKWMPRARTWCALGPGHRPPCRSAASERRNLVGAKLRRGRAAAA